MSNNTNSANVNNRNSGANAITPRNNARSNKNTVIMGNNNRANANNKTKYPHTREIHVPRDRLLIFILNNWDIHHS